MIHRISQPIKNTQELPNKNVNSSSQQSFTNINVTYNMIYPMTEWVIFIYSAYVN